MATKLSNLLRQRAFKQFWSTLRSEEIYKSQLSPAIEALPSFPNLVRKSIARSVADTFKSLNRAKAEEWLGFTEEETSKGEGLDKFVKDVLGWSLEGDLVKIPSNEANDPKSTVQSETVDLSREYAALLSSWYTRAGVRAVLLDRAYMYPAELSLCPFPSFSLAQNTTGLVRTLAQSVQA